MESTITDLRQNILGMKRVAKHLVQNGLLIIGIQPAHTNIDVLQLRGGATYSQKIKYHLPYIDKEYFVTQNGKKVAYQQFTLRRFTNQEKQKLMKGGGFSEIRIDKTKQFLIFKKI